MSEEDTSALNSAAGETPASPAEESVPAPVVNRFADMNASPADDDDSTDHDDSNESSDDDDESDHPMSTLPPYVLERVEKLKTLNTQRDQLMDQYLQDRAALEAKYHDLCKPLYSERAAIIKGEKDEEIGASKEGDVEEDQVVETVDKDKDEKADESQANHNNDENKVVGIPQFWICAMTHMEPLAELIAEDDVDALEHLQNIACVDDADGTGFTLEFHFSPNAYFNNSVLTKRYEIPNLLLDDEPILKNVEGCKIEWKPDMSLTFRETTKKQRGTGKNSGKVRTVKKKERSESFFHFFEPPKMPSMQDLDEEEADRLESAFEDDYDVAQAFRSHIIPKAIMWFTGQVSLVLVLCI